MNAGLTNFYLLYCLSCATGFSRKSLASEPPHRLLASSPPKMPHTPHVGSAPDLPRPLLVRSNSLRQVAAARYLKLFSSPRR
jgi:hypothetical protein